MLKFKFIHSFMHLKKKSEDPNFLIEIHKLPFFHYEIDELWLIVDDECINTRINWSLTHLFCRIYIYLRSANSQWTIWSKWEIKKEEKSIDRSTWHTWITSIQFKKRFIDFNSFFPLENYFFFHSLSSFAPLLVCQFEQLTISMRKNKNVEYKRKRQHKMKKQQKKNDTEKKKK